MKIGIMGLPRTGKKTLFRLLTGANPSPPQGDPNKPVLGVGEILDSRFDSLVEMYRPRKVTRARINLELLPEIGPESLKDPDVFRDIAGMDALCHVVRAFDDDTVYHVSGTVNPERDMDMVNAEVILHDLLFIEKRLERIEKNRKKIDERTAKEEDVLLRFREHLEQDMPLRTLALPEEDGKIIASYPFITLKKLILVLNVSDADMKSAVLRDRVEEKCRPAGIEVMQISARLESEIDALESRGERDEFMKDAGITEPALDLLTRLCMKALGLMSYFTVGEDEVRQWLVRRNSTAPVAAGVIHSDLQKGFIRAEVMKCGDLLRAGSEENVKKAGKFYVMGKEYIVEDGNIISFRFNV